MAHATHPVHHSPDVLSGRSTSRPSGRALLTWAAIIAGLVVAVGLVLFATTSGTGSEQVEPVTPVAPAQPGVPLSPDQAERYLAGQE